MRKRGSRVTFALLGLLPLVSYYFSARVDLSPFAIVLGKLSAAVLPWILIQCAIAVGFAMPLDFTGNSATAPGYLLALAWTLHLGRLLSAVRYGKQSRKGIEGARGS